MSKFINMDRKLLKKGGRTAVKISQEEFLKKIYDVHLKNELYLNCDVKSFSDFSDYEIDYIAFTENPKIEKDLSKIMFCNEDYLISKREILESNEADYPYNLVGINTLENGFTFLGCIVGGDWEEPLFHIIYWDGKSFRGYIPAYGNIYNLDFKTAFGSECDSDNYDEIIEKKYANIKDDDYVEDKITQEYLKRQPGYDYDAGEEKKDCFTINFNWDALREDIMSRIIVK